MLQLSVCLSCQAKVSTKGSHLPSVQDINMHAYGLALESSTIKYCTGIESGLQPHAVSQQHPVKGMYDSKVYINYLIPCHVEVASCPRKQSVMLGHLASLIRVAIGVRCNI